MALSRTAHICAWHNIFPSSIRKPATNDRVLGLEGAYLESSGAQSLALLHSLQQQRGPRRRPSRTSLSQWEESSTWSFRRHKEETRVAPEAGPVVEETSSSRRPHGGEANISSKLEQESCHSFQEEEEGFSSLLEQERPLSSQEGEETSSSRLEDERPQPSHEEAESNRPSTSGSGLGLLGSARRATLRVAQACRNYEYRVITEKGAFVITPLTPEFMDATADLLADCFADSMGTPAYRPFLRMQIGAYLRDQREMLPLGLGVCLVGLWYPAQDVQSSDGTSSSSDVELLDPVLVGTVELSFNAKSRPSSPTLDPPKEATYLCNMAVDKRYRRKGLAKHLLFAAEMLVVELGKPEIYLHVRLVDTIARSLYEKANYMPMETDNFLAWITLQPRRCLMRKALRPPPATIAAALEAKRRAEEEASVHIGQPVL